jgi:beta-glucosidase
VDLQPGETKTVSFILGKRAFAYWNTEIHDWHVETGDFEIMIGSSSKEIACTELITVESTVKLPVVYSMDSTLGDLMEDPYAAQFVNEFLKGSVFFSPEQAEEEQKSAGDETITKEMMMAMLKYMPIRGSISFGNGSQSREDLLKLIDKINNHNQ